MDERARSVDLLPARPAVVGRHPRPRPRLGLGPRAAGAVRPVPHGAGQRRSPVPAGRHHARVLPRRPARAGRALPLSRAGMAGTLDRSAGTQRPVGFGQLLGRLAAAGLIAGALAGVFSLLVTERAIAPALKVEQARAAAAGSPEHGGEVFGRGTQLLGGFLGTLLAGVVLAVVLAAVYGAVRHRLPGRT